MKHILIPTDFSESSWNAIFCAIKMYKDLSCCFYLLNTFQDESLSFAAPLESEGSKSLLEEADNASKEALAQTLKYLKTNTSNTKHSFQGISLLADLVDGVRATVNEKRIDLIVMGTTGATGSKEVFIGSNAVRIVREIYKCPILLIPLDKDFKSLKHLVFATDYTRPVNLIEIEPLLEMATLWKAAASIVHIKENNELTDLQKYHKTLLMGHLHKLECVFHEIPVKGSIETTIKGFLKKYRADMIALVHYRHSFLSRLIREPVIKKITFHTDIPFFILPEIEK